MLRSTTSTLMNMFICKHFITCFYLRRPILFLSENFQVREENPETSAIKAQRTSTKSNSLHYSCSSKKSPSQIQNEGDIYCRRPSSSIRTGSLRGRCFFWRGHDRGCSRGFWGCRCHGGQPGCWEGGLAAGQLQLPVLQHHLPRQIRPDQWQLSHRGQQRRALVLRRPALLPVC